MAPKGFYSRISFSHKELHLAHSYFLEDLKQPHSLNPFLSFDLQASSLKNLHSILTNLIHLLNLALILESGILEVHLREIFDLNRTNQAICTHVQNSIYTSTHVSHLRVSSLIQLVAERFLVQDCLIEIFSHFAKRLKLSQVISIFQEFDDTCFMNLKLLI